MRYLVLLMALSAVISCGSKKELTTPELVETTETPEESPEEMMEEPIITLTKGACFGTCPVYTFSITKSGDMTFEGKRNTRKLGLYTKKLDLNSFQKVLATFEEYKFMELEDFYSSMISDTPTISITYTNSDTTKTVVGKTERPQRVHRIQKELELLAESNDRWKLLKASEKTLQEKNLIKSEIIIATKGGPTLAKWFDKMRVNHGIRIVKRLSAANNTWLISYNIKEYEPEEMLDILRKNDFIVSAEFNSETNNR